MHGANLIGLTGALIAGYAYLPQIRHLISEQCSAGISKSAFGLWFVSSMLVTINAFYIGATVFEFLGAVQIIATGTIFWYSTKYSGRVCTFHQKHPGSF